MTKKITILTFLGVLIWNCSLFAAIPIQHGQIQISQDMSLKDVFDGGLRPYRVSGLDSRCATLGAEVDVIFPTQKTVNMSLKMTNFTVLADDKINRIDLNGAYLDLEVAKEKALEICKAIGVEATGLKETVSSITRSNASTSTWGARWNNEHLKISIRFEPIVFKERVAATIYVFIDWKRPMREAKLRWEPVTPPPGYEHVSMEMPLGGNEDLPPYPSTPHVSYVERQKAADDAQNKTPPSPSIDKEQPTSHQEMDAPDNWSWLLWMIVATMVAGGLWFIIRRFSK